MKLTLGTVWTIVSTTLVIGWGAYSFVFKGTSENKEQNKAIITINNKVDTLTRLMYIHLNKKDSSLFYSRSAYKQMDGIRKVMIKVLKSNDSTRKDISDYIFMMYQFSYNKADSIDLKKKFQYPLMYTSRLESQ